ncbi:hypothetical protein, partial [Thiorhodococcus mannitoliphagus]|uniref:hypothetical protein n=1 Tax=Thiorhodococcus mannitoliphagus TaxID=329406 RepID=UPI00197E06CE
MSNQLMNLGNFHVDKLIHSDKVRQLGTVITEGVDNIGRVITEGVDHMVPHPKTYVGKFTLATLPYIMLYSISVVLIAMTDHNPASAQGAWDFFIPLVALVSTFSGWARHAGDIWQTRARYLLKQIAHWGALLIVIHLLFQSDVQHFLRAETDGFVIVYILGDLRERTYPQFGRMRISHLGKVELR